ncbi:MAG TPA: hypothetical protein VK150_09425 [Geothrix sp.]|nr:hypothetical protein [Geothrix sp.]
MPWTHPRAVARILALPLALLACALPVRAERLLVPMDLSQTDHLKAYGIAFLSLSGGRQVEWLLNYRGGSFLLEDSPILKREAAKRGVLFEVITDAAADRIHAEIDGANMETIQLEKAPKIAVYTPLTKQPWDDAVTLALTYAEIPYAKIYDREIVEGKLKEYDWLHLHHEDFTGQYSKFYASFRSASWYINQVAASEKLASDLGFPSNVMLKKAVVLAIRDYVERGGFLFAMCLATSTLDMALACAKTDATDAIFDNTPVKPDFRKDMDYSLSLAFTGFTVDPDPMSSTHGDIDYNQVNAGPLKRRPANDFVLFDFSPKYDPVPAMLVQNHTDLVKGFFGLATSFSKPLVKKSVTVLGEVQGQPAVRYIHGGLGQGHFTYYGGHDPEDYSHAVGDSPTDLSLHKNSPGYRLILNNILFPAARQKKRKT